MSEEIKNAVLNTEQAAKYICVAKAEVNQSRVTGNLSGLVPPPFIRIGRRVRYRVVDLDEWLDKLPRFETVAQETAASH